MKIAKSENTSEAEEEEEEEMTVTCYRSFAQP